MHKAHTVTSKACILVAVSCALAAGLITAPSMTVFFGSNAFKWPVVVCKIIQILIVGVSAFWIAKLLSDIRSGKVGIFSLILFMCAFGIQLLALVAVYPGAWRWDDIIVLNGLAADPAWTTWQNYLTGIFYTICLITVPVPSFIVLVQIITISVIIAYIGWRLYALYASILPSVFLIVVLVLPPSLNLNLFPLRPALHAYCEILMFFIIFDHYARKAAASDECLVLLACLTALVATWRTECVVYAAIIPVLYCLLFKSADSLKRVVCFGVSVVMLTGLLSVYQSQNSAPRYAIVSYAPVLQEIAFQAVEADDYEYLEELGSVYNVSVLLDAHAHGVSGEAMFWDETHYPFIVDVKKSWTHGADSDYRGVFLKGVVRYPAAFAKVRCELVGDMMGGRWTSGGATGKLFEENNPTVQAFETNYLFNGQINPDLRKHAASYMDTTGRLTSRLSFTYCLWPLLIPYLIAYCLLVFRRSKLTWLLCAFNLHHVLVFLASPAYIFMYYYSFWLGGLLVAIILLCELKRRRRSNSNTKADAREASSFAFATLGKGVCDE